MPAIIAHQHHQTMKRKSSTAGLPGSGRAVKRRASKACHCCRSRKVRCDVVESGIPCTNCRLDEVECVVTEGKRRKKTNLDDECVHRSPVESVEDDDEPPEFNMFDDIDGLKDITVPTKSNMVASRASETMNHDTLHHQPHMIYQTQGHRLSPEERTRRWSALSQPPRPVHGLHPHVTYASEAHSRTRITLPRYILPIPKRILGEDLEYLQKKGALYIPETGIRNELLRSYVQYVHPYLPLLELQDFLTAIHGNGSAGGVSLLLFQSVMFAATAYVDIRYLTAMGYSSRKSARKAFFQRVKLLYDFDWELDRVTVVQSVLLMTYWYESPNEPKDVWHWLGIAISIARTIGLNHSTEGSSLSPAKKQLWKRLWWSCYMRDRLVAIGMRRPIRIREEDYDVDALTVADFETNALPPDLCRMLGGCSAVRDGTKRVTLARMCIAVSEVCKCITQVLNVQYSVLAHQIGVTSETTVRLVPRSSGAEPSDVIKCDRELEQWYIDLPAELRFFMPGTRERTSNHDGEVISMHRALLTGIYLTATSALHRPQMMPVTPSLVIAPELKKLSKRRVREAALDITEIFRELYAHDLIRYLPNTGVTVILPAIIIHLLDIKSPDTTDRQTSMRHFQFCMQALQKLREVYASADFAFSFLDAATRKIDLSSSGTASKSATSVPLLAKKKPSSLTPPPDAQTASREARQGSAASAASAVSSTRSTISALTPPSSEQNLNTSTNNGPAVSLKDLEHIVDIDGMSDNFPDIFPAFTFDTTDTAVSVTRLDRGSSQAASVIHQLYHPQATYGELHLDPKVVPNDFDYLINLEGGSDLFAPTKVNVNDNLFADIDMEWMADPQEHDHEYEHEQARHGSQGDFSENGSHHSGSVQQQELSDSDLRGDTHLPSYEQNLKNSGYTEVKPEDDNDLDHDHEYENDQQTAPMGRTSCEFHHSDDTDLGVVIEDDSRNDV